ncbi:hypothetical protein EYS14_12185 [Alteromonadaceae bacterium M269]|nr:hypothetical protein EYS14_12185 [Alteromonadaceae bacterium M269]
MPNLKMTLTENSRSFFKESLSQAVQAEVDSSKWKFAILLLVQAIETSLKERLRRTNELFVFTNIDSPRRTVDLGLAIERLNKIAKIHFKKADIQNIKTASDLRNQIVHFEFDLSIQQIKSNFVRLVGFYISFCRDNLEYDAISDLPPQLHAELLGLDSYVVELEKRAAEAIRADNIPSDEIWECPTCHKNTYVTSKGKDICYLCSHTDAIAECDRCHKLDFETTMEFMGIGNVNGLPDYKAICKNCVLKIDNEHPYEEYY